MNHNWDRCLNHVLEGKGYIHNRKDPGGKSNLGIPQRVWETYLRRKSTEEEMRNLTIEQVKPFYKRKYWDACNGDFLPLGVDLVVFDYAVNNGTTRSIKTLQKVVGAQADGKVGPETMRALHTYILKEGPRGLIDALCISRIEFARGLADGHGWNKHMRRVRVSSVEMIA